MKISVGIYGATGYTGLELARLLDGHPSVDIRFATSERFAGCTLRDAHPQAPPIPLVAADDAPLDQVESVFLCLPHTKSAQVAVQATGVKIVDLSADLRLDDSAVYARWYGIEHPHPHLLPTPYGLPELGREALIGADRVANPGCYATAVLLGLAPLTEHLRAGEPLIVDAKSGVTGAGRTPKTHTVFGEVHGNFSPYNIGRAHRHIAEIEQVSGVEGLIFSPHLLPTDRGILATMYLPVQDADAAAETLRTAYTDEPLVSVLPPGELATLAHVVRTPFAVLSLTPISDRMLIVVAVIDNLLKGAASQAVQNFNLMWNRPEVEGLTS